MYKGQARPSPQRFSLVTALLAALPTCQRSPSGSQLCWLMSRSTPPTKLHLPLASENSMQTVVIVSPLALPLPRLCPSASLPLTVSASHMLGISTLPIHLDVPGVPHCSQPVRPRCTSGLLSRCALLPALYLASLYSTVLLRHL
jgi:hypothetical protein